MLHVEIAVRKMTYGKVTGEDDILEMLKVRELAGCQYFLPMLFSFFLA
jgi:hypothetical protein